MQHENYQRYILVITMRGDRGEGGGEGGREFTDLFSYNISKSSVIVIQFGRVPGTDVAGGKVLSGLTVQPLTVTPVSKRQNVISNKKPITR